MTRIDQTAAVDRNRDRGQTNIDFVVGIVVFILALSFVVAATPQLLAPYEDQETLIVAERVTSTLADSLLADRRDPGHLDIDCIGAFFRTTAAPCPTFDATESTTDRIGVEATYRVNVTLQWNVTGDAEPEVLCYNGGDVGACVPGGTDPLAVGYPVPQDHGSVASERRTVVVGDQPAILQVRVW